MGRKKSSGIMFSVSALTKYRPKHAALLAGISNAWAGIEMSLANLFSFLVASKDFTTTAMGYTIDPLTDEIWDSFVLIDHRLALVRAAFNTRINDPDLRAELEEVFRSIKRSSRSRAQFVHAAWAVSGSYPDEIIRTKGRAFDHENEQPFGLSEIQKTIDAIVETSRELSAFRKKIEAHLQLRLPPHPTLSPDAETLTLPITFDLPEGYEPE